MGRKSHAVQEEMMQTDEMKPEEEVTGDPADEIADEETHRAPPAVIGRPDAFRRIGNTLKRMGSDADRAAVLSALTALYQV